MPCGTNVQGVPSARMCAAMHTHARLPTCTGQAPARLAVAATHSCCSSVFRYFERTWSDTPNDTMFMNSSRTLQGAHGCKNH